METVTATNCDVRRKHSHITNNMKNTIKATQPTTENPTTCTTCRKLYGDETNGAHTNT